MITKNVPINIPVASIRGCSIILKLGNIIYLLILFEIRIAKADANPLNNTGLE